MADKTLFEAGQEPLDLASKSLSEALEKSFKILKILMWILVFLYLASGIYKVEQYEVALVRILGKIPGSKAERIKNPGLHWTWPYPISEIIRVPAEKKIQRLDLDDLWYFEKEEDSQKAFKDYIPKTLDPVTDGYCLTGDANILHSKWTVRYQITDPYLFVTTQREPEKLLKCMLTNAVIKVMATFDVDAAHRKEVDRLRDEIEGELNHRLGKLDEINTQDMGIKILGIEVPHIVPPRQTKDAFDSVIQAEQEKSKKIAEANTKQNEIFNKAKGEEARVLKEAETYREQIEQEAKADAAYFEEILGKFLENPETFILRQYQDAMETILREAREVIILREKSPNQELRLMINRDPNQYTHQEEEKK